MSQPQPTRGNNLPRHPSEWEFANAQNSLLLNEPFNQTQPGLKAIFKADEAEILQQIVVWKNQPYEDKFLKCEIELRQFLGRWWAKIPPQMMFNPWSGKLRHINRDTAKKKVASLRAQGAIWTANLNEELGTNVNWYTVIDEVVGPLTGTYQSFWNAVMEERYEALKTGRKLSDAREEELFEECAERLDTERKRLKEIGFLPGKHFPWEEVQKIEREERTQTGGRVNLTPPPTTAPQILLPLGSNQPQGGAISPEVAANQPHIQGQNDLIYGVKSPSLYKELTKETKETTATKQDSVDVVDSLNSLVPPFQSDTFQPVADIAPSPALNGITETERLLARISIEEHGITRESALALLQVPKYAAELPKQLDYWQHFPEVKAQDFRISKGAFFIAAVKKPYSPPKAYEEHLKQQAAEERAIVEQTVKKQAEAAQKAKAAAQEEQNQKKAHAAALEYAAMSGDEQAAILQRLVAQGNVTADRVQQAGGIQHFPEGSMTWRGFFEAVDALLSISTPSLADFSKPAAPVQIAPQQDMQNVQIDSQRLSECVVTLQKRLAAGMSADDIETCQFSIGADDLEPEQWQVVVETTLDQYRKAA